MDDLFRDLNPAQREAVSYLDGPLLILAGPGSGKTRVVTTRVIHLLTCDIDPRQVAALTFTNKAADEMRRRLHSHRHGNLVWVSTFHRFCSMLLRRYASLTGLAENFTILDADDSLSIIKSLAQDGEIDLARCSPGQIARIISNAKNDLIGPDEFSQRAASPAQRVAADFYPRYQQRLIQANAVDFDDLLFHMAILLREQSELRRQLDQHFRYLLVDEYQDTNLAQYAIVRALSVDSPNLAVTGDPDQSIYSWRGANIQNILSFERDYPNTKIVRLEQNYRSTQAILRAADELIRHNHRRKRKKLYSDHEEGPVVRVMELRDEEQEAESIAQQIAQAVTHGTANPHDFAIFYRTNALSRVLERALRAYQLPYQILQGLEFYKRKEVKDLLAYLQLVHNPRNDIAFLRAVNAPSRGIGKVSLSRLRSAADRARCSLFEAARNPDMRDELTAKVRKALAGFVTRLDRMRDHVHLPLSELVAYVIAESDYTTHLRESNDEQDRQRLENIEELQSAALDLESLDAEATLDDFLENASLTGETDQWDAESGRVTLMTLHAAKGLEFRSVFIIAAEDNILPHERSLQDPDSLEEERRLMFVGMTRAKYELQLSYVRHRNYRGTLRTTIPSCFLGEIMGAGVHLQSLVPTGRVRFAPPGSSQAPHGRLNTRTRAEQFPKLATAAELLQTEGAPPPPPSAAETGAVFEPGMMVSHPEYGLGKLISLTGDGRTQMARIQFFQPPRQRSFRVAASPLQPVKRP